MLKVRDFDRNDEQGFAGAEGWPSGPPLICEGVFEDTGREFMLIVARNGLTLIVDDSVHAHAAAIDYIDTRRQARNLIAILNGLDASDYGSALLFWMFAACPRPEGA